MARKRRGGWTELTVVPGVSAEGTCVIPSVGSRTPFARAHFVVRTEAEAEAVRRQESDLREELNVKVVTVEVRRA